jgi:hypothetical protein
LKYITNRDYKGGPHGGYAWYAPSERRINLSALCVERGAVWGQLDKSTEFRSVMFHEIGHAVSQKLRREASYDYRKFAVECGWSYAQPEFREGLQKEKHMGSNKIPRRGSNSSNTLLTSYSATSPEEAFAEYYSFYNLNKPAIDRFFETKDRRHLRQEKQTVIQTVSSDIKVGDVVRLSLPKAESYEKYRQVSDHLSERAEHQIKLYSPWELSLSREEKMRLDPGQVKRAKNVDPALLNPAVVVRGQGSKRTAIYGGTTIEVARMNRKMVPVIEISNEQYQRLREQQFKDEEIASFVFEENRLKSIPRQTAPPKQIAGLVYRDEIIPEEVILENVGALKVMKKICESEQLKKALEACLSGDYMIFEKARAGVYENTSENRKLGRVGQKYGSEKKHEEVKDTIDRMTEDLTTKLKDLGYVVNFGSRSETDYGRSNYIYVNKKGTQAIADNGGLGIKVRISDHSVENIGRMQNEIHVISGIHNASIPIAIDDIEAILSPEKFDIIEEKVTVYTTFETPKPLPSDEIISERMSVKGDRKVFTIRRPKEVTVKKRVKKQDTTVSKNKS